MLGEASTTDIVKTKNTRGFKENKKAAKADGKIAGDARRQLEKQSGRKVVSSSNFLNQIPKMKEISLLEDK